MRKSECVLTGVSDWGANPKRASKKERIWRYRESKIEPMREESKATSIPVKAHTPEAKHTAGK